MEPEEEAKLTDQAKTDPEAFAQLYDHFMPVVYGYVMRRVMSKELAEDLTSQVFEKALKSIRGLRVGASFKGWLFKIAGNTIIDYYRSKGRQQTYSLDEAGDMANGKSGKAVEQVDNRVAVMSLLDKLPEGHRTPLVLHFLEGMTVDEMAEALDSTPNACYMKVYRATKAFAELLEQHGIKRIDDYVRPS
ncbi:MAG: RNA polymerase sigma factor [Candidatus Geothermincolia bacterium]